MSSKKRHLELVRKRKERNKRLKERAAQCAYPNKRLMFGNYLENCDAALSQMKPASGCIYRLCHHPNEPIDIYPTALWDYESLTPKEEEFQDVVPPGSSFEDQFAHLKQYSPSFNISDKGAASIFFSRLKGKKNIDGFKKSKGSHIYAYNVYPKDGFMYIEPSGHILFQPYDDFKLEEHIASDFTPVPIEEYLKNETE